MLSLMLFYLFGAILVLAALGVISARNPVHSALALVMCFFTSAVLWLLVQAEFLAIVLVLVYVGAVMVLFLFVVMMLDVDLAQLRAGFMRFAWLGWLTAAVLAFEIAGVVLASRLGVNVARGSVPVPAGYSNTAALGTLLYSRYVYAFEIAAMVLLVAIVAAIALTLRRRPGLKVQNIARQVAAEPRERLRVVAMRSERDDTEAEQRQQ